MQLFQNTIFFKLADNFFKKKYLFALFSDVRVHCENGDLDYKKQDHLFARMAIHLGCHDKF